MHTPAQPSPASLDPHSLSLIPRSLLCSSAICSVLLDLMSFVCSLSGEVPIDPVVNPLSGLIYERSIIQKHLSISPTDPVTGAPLLESQLVSLNPKSYHSPVRPRPPSATSIPSLISILSQEYDHTALELFQLKQQISTLKNELAHALYQQEAGQRVIARLLKERDEAREQLTKIKENNTGTNKQQYNDENSNKRARSDADAAPAVAQDRMEDDRIVLEGISSRVENVLRETGEMLRKDRKKQLKAAADKVSAKSAVQAMEMMGSHPLQLASGDSSVRAGISVMDLAPTDDSIVVTGGFDGSLTLFSHTQPKRLASLRVSAPVSAVQFHPRKRDFLVACQDGSATYFRESSSASPSFQFDSLPLSRHSSRVSSVSFHPSGEFGATIGEDGFWTLHDLSSGKTIKRFSIDNAESPAYSFTAGQFHVDGLIFGASPATPGSSEFPVKIFDVRSGAVAETLLGHQSKIQSMQFAENGVNCVSGDENGVVKVWDLRKVKATGLFELKSLNLKEALNQPAAALPVHSVTMDSSVSYLAVAASQHVCLFDFKDFSLLKSFEAHSDGCTSVRWAKQAKFLASAGLDAALKVWQ